MATQNKQLPAVRVGARQRLRAEVAKLERRPRMKPLRAAVPTEAQEQRVLAQYLDAKGLLWCHVANEGQRSGKRGWWHKQLGGKAGVPDALIFDEPPGLPGVRGVAIELKRETGGVTSEHQKRWFKELTNRDWLVEVCNGADEAVAWLRSIGY